MPKRWIVSSNTNKYWPRTANSGWGTRSFPAGPCYSTKEIIFPSSCGEWSWKSNIEASKPSRAIWSKNKNNICKSRKSCSISADQDRSVCICSPRSFWFWTMKRQMNGEDGAMAKLALMAMILAASPMINIAISWVALRVLMETQSRQAAIKVWTYAQPYLQSMHLKVGDSVSQN